MEIQVKEHDGNVQPPHPSFKGVSKGICVIHFEYVTALKWFKTGPRCRLLWTL